MKLNSIILESTTSLYTGYDEEEFFRNVKKDCSQYVKTNPKYPLFRGMNNRGDFVEERIRQDRAPSGSNKNMTDFMNAVYKEHTGIDKIRNRSVAISPEVSTTEQYGNSLYIVFPTNKSIIVDTGYVDVLSAFDDLADEIDHTRLLRGGIPPVEYLLIAPNKQELMRKNDFKSMEEIDEFLEDTKSLAVKFIAFPIRVLKPAQIDRYIPTSEQMGTEMMLVGDKYYAIRFREKSVSFIKDEFKWIKKRIEEA